MRYAVALVHYDNWPEVLGTLQDLKGQEVPPTVIVVVDNSPLATPLREAVEDDDDVLYLARPENMGYGAGMNAAFEELMLDPSLDAVLCLTHEVRLASDCVVRLLSALETDAAAGAVGPVLCRLDDPDVIWSAGGELSGRRLVAHHEYLGQRLSMLPIASRPIARCRWLEGAALLLRREALMAVRGFDERYFLYWEEVDLALRLAEVGFTTSCVYGATAWQRPSGTPLYLEYRNRLILLRRHGSQLVVLLEMFRQVLEWPEAVAGAVTRRRSCRDVMQRVLALFDGCSDRLHRFAL